MENNVKRVVNLDGLNVKELLAFLKEVPEDSRVNLEIVLLVEGKQFPGPMAMAIAVGSYSNGDKNGVNLIACVDGYVRDSTSAFEKIDKRLLN